MKTLEIKISEWLRGDITSSTGNQLWVEDLNAGCCLGHYCLKIEKMKIQEIQDIGLPSRLIKLVKLLNENNMEEYGTDFKNTPFATEAMKINDSSTLNTNERMKKLTELFATKDIELKFIDDQGVNSNE